MFSDRLDSIADRLERAGLVKEAYEIDVLSNSIEKEAFFDVIKNLVNEIPGASKIRSPKDAVAIIWDFVKKIGAKKVLDTINSVEAMLSKSGTGTKMAYAQSNMGMYVKAAMYPLLFLTVFMLYEFVGKPQVEQLKHQIQTTQQQQMSALDEIKA